jgi:hypothetical protein
MLRLLAVPALALVLGTQTGCSENCDIDYFDWTVRVTVDDLPTAEAATVCIDGECSPLDRMDAAFEGWVDLPSDVSLIDVSIVDVDGARLASFSERQAPIGDSCYRNIVLAADAGGIRWVGN